MYFFFFSNPSLKFNNNIIFKIFKKKMVRFYFVFTK